MGFSASSDSFKRSKKALLFQRGLALFAGPFEIAFQSLQALFDGDQVGQDEFRVQDGDVALRIEAAFDVRHQRFLEHAHDVQERIHLADLVAQRARQPAPPDAFFQPGDVGIGDFGVDFFARLVDFRQAIHARVGHIHGAGADLEFRRRDGGGGPTLAGQRVKDRRLARVGKSDDSNLHGNLHSDLTGFRRTEGSHNLAAAS